MNQAYQVNTIAGKGQQGFQDGDALEAMFAHPNGICCSNDGKLYIADQYNNRIRMIYNNKVTTIAGNGKLGFQDGNALEAMFANPTGVCCSEDGRLYVSDYYNHKIRMIYNNQVTTIAGNGQQGHKDGNALEAMFDFPIGICCSNDGKLYITDYQSHKIRMLYNNQVVTIAGNGEKDFKDGNALEAMFNHPRDICCSKEGILYIADKYNHRIRSIYNNQVTTIAGNGHRAFEDGNDPESSFNFPTAVCISKEGLLYVTDLSNQRITIIDNKRIITIAGNGLQGSHDGNALEATFDNPTGLCISKDSRLYVTDFNSHRIRMICAKQDLQSLFGFALLLDMRNTFCDCQISFNNITYHLHSVLVNVRCPLLLDQSYFSVIQQSKISNESFDSFITFLYANTFTKDYNQRWPEMPAKTVLGLIFIFDLLMNSYQWILSDLKTTFTNQLNKLVEINQQESSTNLTSDLLPFTTNLKELMKKRLLESNIKTNTTCTEHCYNQLVDKLHPEADSLQAQPTFRASSSSKSSITSKVRKTKDQSLVFGDELRKLSKLAFGKTTISKKEMNNSLDNIELELQSLISKKHLDEWTRPDFVIKLCNDDIEYHVHKLILCGRWKYFYLMIESGLKELRDNEMTLSNDWNRLRFEKFIKYIYTNEIEFDSMEDIEWLMENRKLYGITVDQSQEEKNNDKDDSSTNNNQIGDREMQEVAAYGFEDLYDHCVYLLDKKLLSKE